MTQLLLHGKSVSTVFDLLGEHENDLTYSLGWALSQSRHFLKAFIQIALSIQPKLENVTIRLQHSEMNAGITDIEIESPGEFLIILEAKRGWNLPGKMQLEKYAGRQGFSGNKQVKRRILVLSECSRHYALTHLAATKINGIEISPVSWKEIVEVANRARKGSSHAEKRILSELLTYFGGLMTMQNLDSNRVYVVSLGRGNPKGWKLSWIDIAKKKRRYFHPVGKNWPKEPPNYIAFRYFGKLQSIHHVDGYSVFDNPHDEFPEAPSEKWSPYFLYRLSPPFAPPNEVKTGKIYPSGRVWCMLDTLFLAKTISDAKQMSDKRAEVAK
jgi:hypothetical protein